MISMKSSFIVFYTTVSSGDVSYNSLHNLQTFAACCLHTCMFKMSSPRIQGVEAGKINEVTRHSQSMDHLLKKMFNAENPVLLECPEWSQAYAVESEVKVTLLQI